MKAAEVNDKLLEEKRELEEILAKGDTAVREMEDKTRKIEAEKQKIDKEVCLFKSRLQIHWLEKTRTVTFRKVWLVIKYINNREVSIKPNVHTYNI